jgi:hypothetical protein
VAAAWWKGRVAMMTNVRLGLGLFACGAALAYGGAAGAQAAGGAPGGTDRFSFDVHAHTTYESNVAGGNKTIAALRQVAPEDITYNLGASAAFQLPSSRQTFFLRGAADLDRHDKNKVLNGNNYEVSLGGSSQVGACMGSAIATYAHRQALIQDIALPVAKNVVDQESVSANVQCGRRGFFGGLDGGLSKVMNNGKGAAFIDSETRSAAASVGYQNKILGNVALTAQYSEVDYQNIPLTVPPTPSGFSQYGAGVNYSRKIGNRLSGNAGVNYTKLKSNGTSLTSNAFGADVALNYRASPRLGLNLVYSLGNQASAIADAAFVRTEVFRFSGDYRLNTRISLQAGVAKSRNNYRGGQPTILQLRKSDDLTVSGGASLKIGRRISMTLDASHVDRKADLSQFNYTSNRVSLGIIGSF